MLLQKLCNKILFDWMGWKQEVNQHRPNKCIMCVAPHTSNWDFIIGELYNTAMGYTSNFLMKKEWFFWPLGSLFSKIGGIPVERSKHCSLTDQLAEKAIAAEKFSLAVTPEGTRSKVTKWKRGFYFIALKSQIPILLFAIDYANKKIVCTQTIIPTGNVDEDMSTIMNYYRKFKGKYPEKFSIEDNLFQR